MFQNVQIYKKTNNVSCVTTRDMTEKFPLQMKVIIKFLKNLVMNQKALITVLFKAHFSEHEVYLCSD